MSETIRFVALFFAFLFGTSSYAFAPRLQFVSTYLQPGTENPAQNYLPEFLGHLNAAHIGPEFFGRVRETLRNQQAIVDLGDELFDFDRGALLPNYLENLDRIGRNDLDGYENRILALYIADEPSSYGISRQALQTAITATKKRFPGIPTFIIWNQDCFDNAAELDSKCGIPGQRGIPEAIDWVGFDWYFRGNPADDAMKFRRKILPTIARLKALTNRPIVLVPDGTDEYLKDFAPAQRDQIIAKRLRMYIRLAQREPQVIGIDNYAWVDHDMILYGETVVTHVLGLREFPVARQLLFDLADSLKFPIPLN